MDLVFELECRHLSGIVPRILYLARHGETDWNAQNRFQGQTDIALNDAGRRQARALATRLRGRVSCVLGSSLARAAETARIVAATLDVPFAGVDADLRERAFGCFEGLTREECIQRQPAAWAGWTATPRRLPPGAEDPPEVGRRMLAAVRRAASLPEAPLLVTHGGALRLLVFHATGRELPLIANCATYALHVEGEKIVDVSAVVA